MSSDVFPLQVRVPRLRSVVPFCRFGCGVDTHIRQSAVWLLVSLMIWSSGAELRGQTQPDRGPFAERLRLAEERQSAVIEGRPGTAGGSPAWLFFTPELHAVLSAPFWGDQAAQVSRASNPKFADPLAPILDFHSQLKGAGIELWLVPVPAKVAVYPERLSEAAADGNSKARIDQSHVKFYERLRQAGVTVVDLTDQFRQAASESGEPAPVYCLTDSHWSGRGVQVAAKTLASQVRTAAWYAPLPRQKFQTAPQSIEITGDLATLQNEKTPVRETLALTRVFQLIDGEQRTPADDSASPILLMGDSHTLIFHDPTLFAEGCGLADHLAEQLGLRMDVIGVRGSGANAARLNWRRRTAPLAGKRLVIWCFSMREFTENSDGWRVIPITKRE